GRRGWVRVYRKAVAVRTSLGEGAVPGGDVRSATARLTTAGYLTWRRLLPADLLARVNRNITCARRPGFEHAIADDVKELVDALHAFVPFARVEAIARAATLAAHPEFPALATARDTGAFHVLRCVDTKSGWTPPGPHFDSHLMTILIHLQPPRVSRENGDLVLYPHRRQVRGSLANLAQKAWTKIPQALPLWWRRATTRSDLRRG